MDDPLDPILAQLAAAPTHPRLDALEAGVLARISRNQIFRRVGYGLTATTALAAAILGLVGATLPVASAQATPSLSPLSPTYALAPSTLLGGGH